MFLMKANKEKKDEIEEKKDEIEEDVVNSNASPEHDEQFEDSLDNRVELIKKENAKKVENVAATK